MPDPVLGLTPALENNTLAGRTVTLDVERLVGSHLAIIANSGGGKTYCTRKVLEITQGLIQQIVLDPDDEYYTLREMGNYIILGGDNGDAPLTTEGARDLALTLLRHGISAILQLNSMSLWQQQTFMASFLNAMTEAPKSLWHPALVVIDEAHRFCPQGENCASSEAVSTFVSQARKRGFTAVLATQRLAKIDKDITGDVNNWLIGRCGQPLDRKVAADALGFSPTSKEARSIQEFDAGNFFGFGPAINKTPIQFLVSPVHTTHMKSGQAPAPTPPAPAALREILQGIAQAAKDAAAAKATSERPEATTASSGADGGAVRPEERDAAEKAGYVRGHAAGIRVGMSLALGMLRPAIAQIEERAYADETEFPEVGEEPQELPMFTRGEQDDDLRRSMGEPEEMIHPQERPVATDPGGFQPSAPQRRVIDAIMWWKLAGFDSVERKRACIMAGYSPKASTFGVYVSELVKSGCVSVALAGRVSLTPKGQALAATSKTLRGKRLIDSARALLSEPERRVFDLVLEGGSGGMERGPLADALGYSRKASTLGVYISRIVSLGFLVTTPGHVAVPGWMQGVWPQPSQ